MNITLGVKTNKEITQEILGMKEHVLVSQGVEIYRTSNKEEAEKMMQKSNEDYYNYCQKCYDAGEIPADNKVSMYEEG